MPRNSLTKPEWQPKKCCVCDHNIPFFDKDGDLIAKWKYFQRKTCGPECYGQLHAYKRRIRTPIPEPTMMDKFILGYKHD